MCLEKSKSIFHFPFSIFHFSFVIAGKGIAACSFGQAGRDAYMRTLCNEQWKTVK